MTLMKNATAYKNRNIYPVLRFTYVIVCYVNTYLEYCIVYDLESCNIYKGPYIVICNIYIYIFIESIKALYLNICNDLVRIYSCNHVNSCNY